MIILGCHLPNFPSQHAECAQRAFVGKRAQKTNMRNGKCGLRTQRIRCTPLADPKDYQEGPELQNILLFYDHHSYDKIYLRIK